MAIAKGRFYFKITSNGNLLGEYDDEEMTYTGTESAVRLDQGISNKTTLSFLGEFATCWLENNKTPQFAKLLITEKKNSNPNSNLFELKWTMDNKKKFEGEGMLCDNILIGSYK
jgi:hypothetical protein